jgi:hypothetical protein
MFNLNYGEYIFQQLITSKFIKNKLTNILIALFVNILNLHLVSILCFIFSFNILFIDFFIHIFISIFMSLNIYRLYNIIEKYQPEFYKLTKYIIKNYTLENYRLWKKSIIIFSCCYFSILLYFITITKQLIFIYILEYLICFIILEQIEQNKFHNFINEFNNKPIIKHYSKDKTEKFLINSYYQLHNLN